MAPSLSFELAGNVSDLTSVSVAISLAFRAAPRPISRQRPRLNALRKKRLGRPVSTNPLPPYSNKRKTIADLVMHLRPQEAAQQHPSAYGTPAEILHPTRATRVGIPQLGRGPRAAALETPHKSASKRGGAFWKCCEDCFGVDLRFPMHFRGLPRKTNALQQILKARIGAQVIPFRFHFQENHPLVPLFVTSLQPGECVVALA